MIARRRFLFLLLLLLAHPAQARDPGEVTVLWISVDGFRPDYIDGERTPYLADWARGELFSDEVVPVVPSLTFPSHVSQATGVPVKLHGISGNSFYHPESGKVLDFPHQAALVQAEPLWQTATRQGLEVMVYDWPLSHAQEGPHASRYFGARFEKKLSDQQRLDRILATWHDHRTDPKLRLLMGYIHGTDGLGHAHGPDSPEVRERSVVVDSLLQRFIEQARLLWEERKDEGDSLVVVLTTDHGMETVHTVVHPWTLFDYETDSVAVAVNGNMANLHLPEASPEELATRLEHLRRHDFLKAYPRTELPPEWGYDHPDRVGEIVVILNPGYTFSERASRLLTPVEEVGEPRGMHGYIPAESEAMNGFLLMRRFPESFPSRHLGRIDSLTLHANIARLLGIEPAQGAKVGRPLLENP